MSKELISAVAQLMGTSSSAESLDSSSCALQSPISCASSLGSSADLLEAIPSSPAISISSSESPLDLLMNPGDPAALRGRTPTPPPPAFKAKRPKPIICPEPVLDDLPAPCVDRRLPTLSATPLACRGLLWSLAAGFGQALWSPPPSPWSAERAIRRHEHARVQTELEESLLLSRRRLRGTLLATDRSPLVAKRSLFDLRAAHVTLERRARASGCAWEAEPGPQAEYEIIPVAVPVVPAAPAKKARVSAYVVSCLGAASAAIPFQRPRAISKKSAQASQATPYHNLATIVPSIGQMGLPRPFSELLVAVFSSCACRVWFGKKRGNHHLTIWASKWQAGLLTIGPPNRRCTMEFSRAKNFSQISGSQKAPGATGLQKKSLTQDHPSGCAVRSTSESNRKLLVARFSEGDKKEVLAAIMELAAGKKYQKRSSAGGGPVPFTSVAPSEPGLKVWLQVPRRRTNHTAESNGVPPARQGGSAANPVWTDEAPA